MKKKQYDPYPGYEKSGLTREEWIRLNREERKAVYLLIRMEAI